MLTEAEKSTVAQFLVGNFSRVSPAVARRICTTAKVPLRAGTKKMGRPEADALYPRDSGDQDRTPGDRLHLPDWRRI